MRHPIALLLALALAHPAQAQTAPISCQSSPAPIALYDPAPAQDSLPALVRNVLPSDPSATTPGLDFTVLVPGDMTPGCPAGSLEPVRDIRYLGEGRFAGVVVRNSLSFHSHLFGQSLAFDAAQVWDWQWRTPETQGRLYGAYRLRAALERAVDGGAIMRQLMPSPLPPDWN
ncbi:hypothetical protein [Gymnodinialimonas sp.]